MKLTSNREAHRVRATATASVERESGLFHERDGEWIVYEHLQYL